MKITITREFTTADEAMEFLARVQGPSPAPAQPPITVNLMPSTAAEAPQPPAAKKPRKPRADAGQPRGEYRHRTTGGAGSPPAGATSPAPQEPEPSTPSAAPAKSPALEPSQAAQAPAAADLTLADLRETLGKLNSVAGKGMESCIAALQKFGVLRVSDLPKEKYAEFNEYVRGQLPAEKKA